MTEAEIRAYRMMGVEVSGPTYHSKGCTCGHRALCDGSGTMPVYAFSFKAGNSVGEEMERIVREAQR